MLKIARLVHPIAVVSYVATSATAGDVHPIAREASVARLVKAIAVLMDVLAVGVLWAASEKNVAMDARVRSVQQTALASAAPMKVD